MNRLHITVFAGLLLISSTAFAVQDGVSVYISNSYNNYGPKGISCELDNAVGINLLSETDKKGGTVPYNKTGIVSTQRVDSKTGSKTGKLAGKLSCYEESPAETRLFEFYYLIDREKKSSTKTTVSINKAEVKETKKLPARTKIHVDQEIKDDSNFTHDMGHTVKFTINVQKD